MNTRVEEDKDEDGRAHVPDTDPHADDGSGVMVALQVARLLALHQDDDGIDDFVKLAEVEDPSVECETFVPESAGRQRGRRMRLEELVRSRVRREPQVDVRRGIVDRCIAVSLGTLNLAHGIDCRHQSALGPLPRTDKRPPEAGGDDAYECPCRVDGQENIVQNDEPEECARLANCPWLSSAGPVVLVERLDDDGVDDGHIDRDFDVEPFRVDVFGDRERRKGGRCRRDRRGFASRGIVEERRRREPEPDGWMVHHGEGCLSGMGVDLQRGKRPHDRMNNITMPTQKFERLPQRSGPATRNSGWLVFIIRTALPRGGLVPRRQVSCQTNRQSLAPAAAPAISRRTSNDANGRKTTKHASYKLQRLQQLANFAVWAAAIAASFTQSRALLYKCRLFAQNPRMPEDRLLKAALNTFDGTCRRESIPTSMPLGRPCLPFGPVLLWRGKFRLERSPIDAVSKARISKYSCADTRVEADLEQTYVNASNVGSHHLQPIKQNPKGSPLSCTSRECAVGGYL